MATKQPIDLSQTPVHIASTLEKETFKPLDWFTFDGPSFGRYVAEECADDNPGRLAMIEASTSDWPSWERHTLGDELVVILEGSGVFYQQTNDGEDVFPFKAGDTILNPKNVWHTADITEPTRALYLTPCPGTEHKPRT